MDRGENLTVTYSDIQTELNTQWNVAVIAKPTFYNGQLSQASKKLNALYIAINEMPDVKDAGFSGALSKRITIFSIDVCGSNRTNLDLFIQECRRILQAKAITSGWWRMAGEPLYKEKNKFVFGTMIFHEMKYITSTW